MNKTLLRDIGNYTNWCGDILPEMYFVYLLEFWQGMAFLFVEAQVLLAGELLSGLRRE